MLAVLEVADRDGVVVASIVRLLADFPDPSKWPALRARATDPWPVVRAAAVTAPQDPRHAFTQALDLARVLLA